MSFLARFLFPIPSFLPKFRTGCSLLPCTRISRLFSNVLIPPISSNNTPMMLQWKELKEKYPNTILLFQVGSFYEMFEEDAKIASELLGLAIANKQPGVNMAGFPVFALESFIARLVKAGHVIVVCDQVENKEIVGKIKSKNVVKVASLKSRQVTRVVTRGTLFEDALLDPKRSNFLLAMYPGDQFSSNEKIRDDKQIINHASTIGISYIDVSTGEFRMMNVALPDLGELLARISPREILLPESLNNSNYKSQWNLNKVEASVSFIPDNYFDISEARKLLQSNSSWSNVYGYSVSAILNYLKWTLRIKSISDVSVPNVGNFHVKILSSCDTMDDVRKKSNMMIDSNARKALEIAISSREDPKKSLIGVIDFTKTSSGGRLLRSHIASPLLDLNLINQRLDVVDWFVSRDMELRSVRRVLDSVIDIERYIQRLSLGRGGPRDFISLSNSLLKIENILSEVTSEYLCFWCSIVFSSLPTLLSDWKRLLKLPKYFVFKICSFKTAFREDCSNIIDDGNFIQENINSELDNLRKLNFDVHGQLEKLSERYKKEIAVSSLKISRHNIFGLVVEVPIKNRLNSEIFLECDYTKTVRRYRTRELSDLQKEIDTAGLRAILLEKEIFEVITRDLMLLAPSFHVIAEVCAHIDVSTSMAEFACHYGLVRPLVSENTELNIVNGKHIVVASSNSAFTPNDCLMTKGQLFWNISGPNMGGKSTFLRQNALICILAQSGSFVPASSASIGLVDAIFTRIGASDDLSNDQSTFMVEMLETSYILRNATSRSLVILDEIGRGTSYADGIALAYAISEHLQLLGCRTLFASHFSLERLAKLSNVKNMRVSATLNDGKLFFPHKILSGVSNDSMGIHVARLAGIPSSVCDRAESIKSNWSL